MNIFKNFKGKKNDNIVIDENLGKQLKIAKRFGLLIVGGLIVAVGIFSSIYSVSEQEQAVITQKSGRS